jgi:ribonuclease-3
MVNPYLIAQFQSYVAGVYVSQGLQVVQSWLSALFRPYVALAYRVIRAEYGFPPEPIPTTPLIAAPSSSAFAPPPSLQHKPPSTFDAAPRGVTTGHLSLFNQYLQQRGKYVEWVWAESDVSSGKATPVWAVRAMVDGGCLGKGKATTKKAAKNEAAKEALLALGVYGVSHHSTVSSRNIC